MNLKKLLLLSCNVFGLVSFAQVGINTTTPNAQLDIRATSATSPSNTDGLLIPKVNVFPVTNPTAAQQGMLVYLTTAVGTQQPGFYYWDNPTTTWIGIGSSASGNNWALAGNTVNAATDFMGSTNNADVIFKRGNFRAGRLGVENTSFGANALNPASTGEQNTAVGEGVLRVNTTGNKNAGNGFRSLYSNTTGFNNTATGYVSLYSNITGANNTANGYLSLAWNTGDNNSGIGSGSLNLNSTGNNNTATGYNSLYNNTAGSNNTGLGYNTQTGTNLTNATAIGANASATTSNSLVLGSINGVNGATASVNVGIGTTVPADRLHVVGNIRMVDGNQAAGKVLTSDANGTATWQTPTATGNNWALAGNTVNATTDFMGSANDADVIFKRNNTRAGRIGANNVSLGLNALNTATTGSWNAAMGGSALLSNTSGSSNTAVGDDAARGNTTGGFNTALGSRAIRNNTTGNNNVGIGYQALESNNANENVAIGNHALQNTTTGYQNTAIGTNALLSNTTGYENSATGLNALRSNTTGRWLTANGAYALRYNTNGEGNTGIGVTALENNTTGDRNTALGQASLRNNTTGTDNVGIGYQALSANSASNNVAVGSAALQNNTTGNYNTAMGYSALRVSTTSNWNQAIGYEGLEFNTTGVSNTSIGGQTLRYNSSGSWSTALGGGALGWNTTGNNNTAVGFWALGSNVSGYGNTALGREAFSSNANYNNSTALGYLCQVTASNQVRIGNNSVTSIGGQVGWTTLSDARFKTESNQKVPGIDFIKKLRPITYFVNHEVVNNFLETNVVKSLNGRKGLGADASTQIAKSSIPEKTLESGFMAQEVEQAAKELGYDFNGVDAPKNEKDYYGLRYSQFVVPLVKAVQELNEKVEQKQTENDQLKAMLLELEKRIAKLEKGESN